MAIPFASPVFKPAATFLHEPMSPPKPTKQLAREHCDSDCSTYCPSTAASDLMSPYIRGRGWSSAGDDLEALAALPPPALGMVFEDVTSLFLPANATPWPESPPCTPRNHGISAPGVENTPPRAQEQRYSAKPCLLRALQNHDVDAVKEVLENDAEAANEIFWEQGCEPPICLAVRILCSPTIIAELLSKGANVKAEDVKSRTPYMLLQEGRSVKYGPAFHYDWNKVEILLLEAGADVP